MIVIHFKRKWKFDPILYPEVATVPDDPGC